MPEFETGLNGIAFMPTSLTLLQLLDDFDHIDNTDLISHQKHVKSIFIVQLKHPLTNLFLNRVEIIDSASI